MSLKHIATDEEIQSALGDYPEHYLHCRLATHQWEFRDATEVHFKDDRRQFCEATFVCRKCTATKIEIWGVREGYKYTAALDYSQAPGYLIQGVGHIRKDHIRKEVIRRHIRRNAS